MFSKFFEITMAPYKIAQHATIHIIIFITPKVARGQWHTYFYNNDFHISTKIYTSRIPKNVVSLLQLHPFFFLILHYYSNVNALFHDILLKTLFSFLSISFLLMGIQPKSSRYPST